MACIYSFWNRDSYIYNIDAEANDKIILCLYKKKLRFRINNLEKVERNVISMTAIRQEAIELLVKLQKDKLMFIIQIIQDVKGLYGDNKSEKRKLFQSLKD